MLRLSWLFLLTSLACSLSAQQVTPSAVISAASAEADVVVRLTGLAKAPAAAEISLGPLANAQKPDRQIIPTVTAGTITQVNNDWDVALKISNLLPFGDSTIPVLVNGKAVQTLLIRKVGLIPKPAIGDAFEVSEGEKLTIVLDNPAVFDYKNVNVRLRFQNTDSKAATVSVGRHAPTMLSIEAPDDWFLDSQTGFPRSGKRTGLLTLQFTGADKAVYEQASPIEVNFRASNWSIFGNLVCVGILLGIGALLALVLRVAIPNYRKKKLLKTRIADAGNVIRDISRNVDSMVRVLLNVERLRLDQLRRNAWIATPSFDDFARRIDQSLTLLNRKIEFARRLDAVEALRTARLADDPLPTRIDAADHILQAVCQTLLRDQLAEQDWVSLQQALDSATKLLSEPTPEEVTAIQAKLLERWKALRVQPIQGWIETTFPEAKPLLQPEVQQGASWISAVGLMRADLQLGVLELLRDFVFPAPATDPNVKHRLTALLASPSLPALVETRLVLREISENVDASKLAAALAAGEASLEFDPQTVFPNDRVSCCLRFKEPSFNSAAARRSIECEWTFTQNGAERKESGWQVYYAPEGDKPVSVAVCFFDNGKPVAGTAELPAYRRSLTLKPTPWDWGGKAERIFPEALQIGAALLVPLAALAVTQSEQGTTGQWWQLVALGFNSEVIRGILTGNTAT